MAEFILLKHRQQGFALYEDRQLVATWDRREPLDHIERQMARRAGGEAPEYTEKDHGGGAWPEKLAAKPGPKPKAPADSDAEQ